MTITREELNAQAAAKLATRTLAQLLNCWDMTERMTYSAELAITRGWLMDELERRDPEAFARWLDNDYSQHPELDTPRAWFAA